jgi:hypothetical protein
MFSYSLTTEKTGVVMTKIKAVRAIFKYGCYVFLSFILSHSALSCAEAFHKDPEFNKGVLIYKPVNIDWQDIDVPPEGFKYLKTATVVINLLSCEQRYIPIRVIYDSDKLRDSYSGYYQIDGKKNSTIKLKILNFRMSESHDVTTFNHIEVDSTYVKCLGDVMVVKFSGAPFILKSQTEKNYGYTWSSSKHEQGKPVIFDKLYSKSFKLKSDSSINFKGLVVPQVEIQNKEDWFRICNPTFMQSKFEKNIMGRAIVCGVTNELANIDRYTLKRGESIRFIGKVSAGSAFLVISRVGGGVVKIAVLNRGAFAEEYRVSDDGEYSFSLSSNMSVYKYPYLDFKLSLRHLS